MTDDMKESLAPEEEVLEEEETDNGGESTTEYEEEESKATGKKIFSIESMLEAGVHFGHRTMRWNSKMSPYIYGARNNIHIIDLTQTVIMLGEACRILREIAKKGGKILFVCTKKQGAKTVKELAEKHNQFYVNHKWLGGTLTNWKVVSQSIRKIKFIENKLAEQEDKENKDNKDKIIKKEMVVMNKTLIKLRNNLDGIRSMGTLPDMLFVIDTVKESLAISEARSLGIPVMAIIDTNSNPDVVDYPIPGNDDSIRAIKLYCDAIDSVLSGINVVRTERKSGRNSPQLKGRQRNTGRGGVLKKRTEKK
jgi:small subunit ribosomal protein S2